MCTDGENDRDPVYRIRNIRNIGSTRLPLTSRGVLWACSLRRPWWAWLFPFLRCTSRPATTPACRPRSPVPSWRPVRRAVRAVSSTVTRIPEHRFPGSSLFWALANDSRDHGYYYLLLLLLLCVYRARTRSQCLVKQPWNLGTRSNGRITNKFLYDISKPGQANEIF